MSLKPMSLKPPHGRTTLIPGDGSTAARLAALLRSCPCCGTERILERGKPGDGGHITDRPGHEHRYAIDRSTAPRELGNKAEVTLERGLQDTFAGYLDHQWGWRGVMDGSDQHWIETHYR